MANATKQQIIDTFLDLTLKQSVDKISISKLMQITQLQRETFYYYFDDKYSLVEETLRSLLFNSYVKMLKSESLDEANQAVMNGIINHKNFYQDLLSGQNEYMFKKIYCQVSVDVITDYLKQHYANDISDSVLFAACFYAYAVNTIIYDWIETGMQEPVDKLVAHFRTSIPEILAPYFYTKEGQTI